MTLTAGEESLIQVVRALPPEEAGRILEWARQLAELSHGAPVDWSDSWSPEDLADARRASLRHLDRQENNSD